MARTAAIASQENDFISTSSYVTEVSFAAVAGQGILVGFRWQDLVTLNSVADTAGNTYVRVTDSLVQDSERSEEWFFCQTAAFSHATNFVTATFSGNCVFKAGWAIQRDDFAASAVDDVAIGSAAESDVVTTAAYTTTQADTAIYAACTQNNSWGDTRTPSGSFAVILESDEVAADNMVAVAEWEPGVIQTAQTMSVTTVTANSKLLSLVALKLGGGGGTPTPARIIFQHA